MKSHEELQGTPTPATLPAMSDDDIRWMSTGEAARRLGVTVRTLYRLIDESELPAYKFGRVIRLQEAEVESFITASRITPGDLEHLYPEAKKETSDNDANPT
jgi:excisionase family DNA binding protein